MCLPLTEPPPLYSLACVVLNTTFSWQVQIGRGFQYICSDHWSTVCSHDIYPVTKISVLSEILPFLICIGCHVMLDLCKLAFSYDEIMQMSNKIIMLKDISNEF